MFESIKNIYNRVTGTPELPSHFKDDSKLPDHLRGALSASEGDLHKALKSTPGDLDRELLRVTYDKHYYKEPLMGYKSMDKFVTKYGEHANEHQLRNLSPADRLSYVAQ